jgi:hypothetical protein
MGWKAHTPEPQPTRTRCLVCGEIVADRTERCYIHLEVPHGDDPAWQYEAHERCLKALVHPSVEAWFKRDPFPESLR